MLASGCGENLAVEGGEGFTEKLKGSLGVSTEVLEFGLVGSFRKFRKGGGREIGCSEVAPRLGDDEKGVGFALCGLFQSSGFRHERE